jgi:hypothetical protein
MLLDRKELSNFEVLDREADPKNPLTASSAIWSSSGI